MVRVLILHDSRGGLVEQLAGAIAMGVSDADGEAVLRRIEDAKPAEMIEAEAMIVGSPNWTGMTGRLKEWFDGSGDLWETGELDGKIGAAFTAGYSRSGGTEATLLQLAHLLLGHGMVFVGLPWSEAMRTSGSYYGASAHGEVAAKDLAQARALGARVARIAAGRGW